MGDRELRQVLLDVIEDIDTGRAVPRRGRGFRLLLAGSALAAGLSLAGCDRAVMEYGAPPTDAYVAPIMDARPEGGAVDAYGIPMLDAGADAAPTMDASVAADADLDDGGVFLYGVPPMPQDEEQNEE